ncbi:glycosyl transferase [Sporothrix brasiliensis 5110]|uniref:Glycosyl transferase n=1 Tax=Sporothrix brasiliensis 5110 TaxID=1398154 RepID=A0A0C2ISH8_9PEZI|nr:glycosyl transferase [Sporothrix brasiliensis 5110]KIH89805.1 glycosyl transferase [Sporothrix brasiliensis 5110]
MSQHSSRSSSITEKMTPPGSPRTPASAFAATTAKAMTFMPSIPDWIPESVRQKLQYAQLVYVQTYNKASPIVAHYYMDVSKNMPVGIPARLRRLANVYAVVVCVLLLFVHLSMSSGSAAAHRAATSVGTVHSDFPHKIWQTWKVNPLEFEEREHNTAYSWLARNPDYQYEVLTDGNEYAYVEFHFGPEGFNRPDIVDFYRNVRATIVRADLLRYMIMYADGGVYADIDVEALKPMSKFIPERYNKRDIDMVIGVEIDEPDWKDHPILGQKSRSFCQWTFMSKPQNPIMMRLIEQIMAWLHGVADKQKVSISEVVLDFDEIITGTGPSAFTNAILDHINRGRSGKNLITWDYFHDMSESKLIGGVLALTVEAFAAGQGHSDSGNHDARAALVRHHYHASNWPSRHPRYRHPVYGEVEKCNWVDDCVKQWDADVADFKKLSEKEQRERIEQHEREVKEQEAKDEEDRKQRQREEEEERERREQEEEDERRRKEEQQRKEEEDRRKKNNENKGSERKEGDNNENKDNKSKDNSNNKNNNDNNNNNNDSNKEKEGDKRN